jgi:hypothetical protein
MLNVGIKRVLGCLEFVETKSSGVDFTQSHCCIDLMLMCQMIILDKWKKERKKEKGGQVHIHFKR